MAERWTPAYARMFDPDHELAYGETCPRFAWLDLCHNARWEDGTRVVNGVVVPLKRGEVLASLRWMSERWGWSIKKVRTFVNLLSSPGIAKLETVRETPQGTVYRIVSYDTYADLGHDPGHSTQKQQKAHPGAQGEAPSDGLSGKPGHTKGHTKGHDRGTPGAHPGHKEQQGLSGDIMDSGGSAREEIFGTLDPLSTKSIKGLYGWPPDDIIGTDEMVWPNDSGWDFRRRCIEIAVQRIEGEGRSYNGRLFRRIIETVVSEQTGETKKSRRSGPLFPEAEPPNEAGAA